MSLYDRDVELLSKADVGQGSEDLLGKFEAQATAELLGRAVIRNIGSAELLGKFDVGQDSTELLGGFDLGQGSAELLGRFDLGQDSTDLLGRFEAQDTAELLGRFEAQATAELLGRFEAQATAELLGKVIIRNIGSTDLLGRFEAQAIAELLGKFDVGQDSTDLLGTFEVQATAELLGKAEVRQPGFAELLGRFEAQAIADLFGKVDITHSVELLGKFEAQATAELLGIFEAQATAELLGKGIVRNIGSTELSAIFWIRHPYRLWTNRRYLNGVVELTEILIGNAILEYVIEGVMQDTQSYLINAGLDYSEWTNIVLTPKLIRRATTYGTVAALYARRAKTFATRVIPTMAPVTITTIGDEERAMNHWRDKMNQMLEFYVTSQGGDVMLTSTSDEEPVFSTEDIPPELTDYTSWYLWLMKRTQ